MTVPYINPRDVDAVQKWNEMVDVVNNTPFTTEDVENIADGQIANDTDLMRNSNNLINLTDLTIARGAIGIGVGGFVATSTTSDTIAVGSTTITIEANLYLPDDFLVRIKDDGAPTANYMQGTVTSYIEATGVLTVNVTDILGSGTFSAWTLEEGAEAGGSVTLLPIISSSTVGQTPITALANVINKYGGVSSPDLQAAYTKVHAANDIFFAFNSSNFGGCYTSTDGVTWTVRSFPVSEMWTRVTYSATSGRYLVSSQQSSEVVLYSTDLVSWTSVSTTAGAGTVRALISDGTNVSRICEAGNDFAWSNDGGATWSTIKTGNPFVSGSGRLNAYFEGGKMRIVDATSSLTSSDGGSTWATEAYTGLVGNISAVYYNHYDGTYIGYTTSREFWTSTDLLAWTLVGDDPFYNASATNPRNMIQKYDDIWIYFRRTDASTYNPSDEGWMFTSTDFITWVPRATRQAPVEEGNPEVNDDPFFSNSVLLLGWRGYEREDGSSGNNVIVGNCQLNLTTQGGFA